MVKISQKSNKKHIYGGQNGGQKMGVKRRPPHSAPETHNAYVLLFDHIFYCLKMVKIRQKSNQKHIYMGVKNGAHKS